MQSQEIARETPGKIHIQKLLEMDERMFFAESVMFLCSKMIGLAEGRNTSEEYRQSKALVDGMIQMRRLAPYLGRPLPKYPERGWLFPYLYEGSCLFDGRWDWWLECLLAERVEGRIPPIEFRLYGCDDGVKETIQHIESILHGLESMIGVSSSLMTLVSWLLWSLGSKSIEERRWSEKVDRYLHENFELGRLQSAPYDYMAKFAQETKGNGRWANPTSFYNTPLPVAECMARMLFHGIDDITKSVIDPCAGTGTLLLAASNYSVNLYAVDIAWDLCALCEVNAYLYMPWVARPAPWLKTEKIGVSPQNPTAEDGKRVIWGDREFEFHQKDGQLTFFEM